MFGRQATTAPTGGGDFSYLDPDARYFDTACQTLRPQCVIDAELGYYTSFNACGGRVKYAWGGTVDREVEGARQALLEIVGKSEKEYVVAFTLNTTYGINLLVQQLAPGSINEIVTSTIEHNSVMLPAMTVAQKYGVPLRIVPRSDDGALTIDTSTLQKSLVIANTVSNIDGRRLINVKELADAVHRTNGLLILDGAQAFAHDPFSFRGIDFDALCSSGHKMYGPSLGFMILKRSLLAALTPSFIGGGTVSRVGINDYSLLHGTEAHAALEPGLQNWAGIVGLHRAMQWLTAQDERRDNEQRLAIELYDELRAIERIRLMNTAPRPILCFDVEGISSHELALILSEKMIMCRSGSFCCHRFIDVECKLPPQLRVSLGLHTRREDIDVLLTTLRTILTTL